MHPMARIKRLQTHVREEPPGDGLVPLGNVPRLGSLDEQRRTLPRSLARSKGEMTDGRDGFREDIEWDPELQSLGLRVDQTVCQ